MADELGHRLLGHPRPLGKNADGRAGVVEVLEDRSVGRADGAVTGLRRARGRSRGVTVQVGFRPDFIAPRVPQQAVWLI